MLESWSISKRIGSGFAILTLMLIGLALFSHRAVGALGTGYSNYRTTTLQGIAVREAMEDLFEAKLAVRSYVETPVSAQRNEAIGNLDEVLDSTSLNDAFEPSSAEGVERDRLLELTRTYKDRFFSLAGQLVDVHALQADIEAQTELLTQNASNVFSSAVQNGNPSIVSAAGRVLQSATETTLQSKRYILTSAPADLDAFVAENTAFNRAADQLQRLGVTGSLESHVASLIDANRGLEDNMRQFSQNRQTALDLQSNVIDQIGSEIDAGFDRFADSLQMRQELLGPRGAAIVAQLQTVIPIIGVIAVIVAILASLVIGRWINGAVSRLVDTTERLAAGEDDIDVTGTEHKHELSRMARALLVFRDAQVERKQASAERAKLREQQDSVVNTMKSELAQLAAGDLTAQIDTAFASEYEDLRHNFNEAVSALESAIARVAETAQSIMATTSDTNTATNDLSQRTENQAATLEQTAAALDQLTASVKSAAEHAKSVDASVAKARSEAEKNGEIVASAVSAMGEIEESSQQITQVIGVIDDIAFQTNLLALNAGVEAARAGESGKGFAVVASEVRALAQRSADAAKEISGLIENSSRHVAQGTQLVGNAGEALTEIITQVNDISSMTSQIATSAEEQAIGLNEINLGVNQLDQATQQNAAMVQDSIKRGDTLASATDRLNTLIRHFQVSSQVVAPIQMAEPSDALTEAIAQTHTDAAPAPPPMKKAVVSAGAAQPDWEDF